MPNSQVGDPPKKKKKDKYNCRDSLQNGRGLSPTLRSLAKESLHQEHEDSENFALKASGVTSGRARRWLWEEG